jgi:hypothetical protein
MPGAVNAALAHAIALLTEPEPADRLLNLCCGSGTLLIERHQRRGARLRPRQPCGGRPGRAGAAGALGRRRPAARQRQR